ncbi:MAG: hypothetical protein WCA81_03785 [Rhizomicrobium sp.]
MTLNANNKYFVIGISIAALLIAGLCLNMHQLPIGSFFWDQLVIDNASYVLNQGDGHRALFLPPLPASAILFYWLASHFPTHPNPLLGGQVLFSLFLFPALLVACLRQSPRNTVLLLVPYLLIAFLPFQYENFFYRDTVMHNVVYNREGALALYVFVALLQTVRWRLRFIPISYTLVVLLFSKPNFALAGFILLVLWATMARHRHRELPAVLGSTILILAGLQLTTHSVLPYFADSLELVTAASSGAGGRLVTFVFNYGQISFGVALLALAVALYLMKRVWEARRFARWYRSVYVFIQCNRTAVFLFALIVGGYIVESQNTGSWYFYYLWPAILSAFKIPLANRTGFAVPKVLAYVGTLTVFCAFWIQAIFRTALFLSTLSEGIPATTIYDADFATYIPSSKLLEQGRKVYTVQRLTGTYESVRGHKDYNYSELFQSAHPAWSVAYLITLQSAERRLRQVLDARPADKRRILVLSYSDPFTKALGLVPYRTIPTCLDASRISLRSQATAVQDASLSADAIVVTNCGMTSQEGMLGLVHKNALSGRSSMRLNECWVAYVKDLAHAK